MSYDKKKAKGWRKLKVDEMNDDQRKAYEENLERQREARQRRKDEAVNDAVEEGNDFAKRCQAAMKKFPPPFEQYYTDDVGMRILMWLTCGGTLTDVCSERGIPDYPVVMQWIRPYLPIDETLDDDTLCLLETFRHNYIEARKNKLEKELDDIICIADKATNKDTSAAAKVRVQARVTMLERINVSLFAPASKNIDTNEDSTPMTKLLADAYEEVMLRRKQRLGQAGEHEVFDIQAINEAKRLEGGEDGAR